MTALIGQTLNFLLSLLFWLLIGRIVLEALIGQRPNVIATLFQRLTDPVLRLVRRATPSFVADRYIPLVSLILLTVLRVLLLPLLRQA